MNCEDSHDENHPTTNAPDSTKPCAAPRCHKCRRAKFNTLSVAPLLGMIAQPAYADSGWDELASAIYLGLLPLLVLLAGVIVSLFVSHAPRLDKFYSVMAFIYGVMGVVMLFGHHVVQLQVWMAPICWIVPLLTWWGMSTWLRRRAKKRNRDARQPNDPSMGYRKNSFINK